MDVVEGDATSGCVAAIDSRSLRIAQNVSWMG